MAEFPALPLFTDAFISDTLEMDAEQTGAYLMLLMVAWRSPDCELPDDDEKLARFARCTKSRWKKIRPHVLKFFSETKNGTFFQKRLKKEREFVRAKAEANRENGKRGGRPKSLENNEPDKANGSVSVNPNETERVTETQSEKNLPTPTPTPTLNSPPMGTPPKADKSKGTRLDEKWWPDESDKQYAIGKGLTDRDVDREAEKFRNYWRAKAGQSARKVDWGLTWRNWCLTAAKDLPEEKSIPWQERPEYRGAH